HPRPRSPQPRRRVGRPPHLRAHRTAVQSPALEPAACETMPVPFASFALDPRLLEGVRDLGFTQTRPVQTAVIPLALAGHDLIACAATGTGKTAAFVVPTLHRLMTAASAAAPIQPAPVD